MYQEYRTPVKSFKINKAKLQYKQLCQIHGIFYIDFMKVGDKFRTGFIEGILYIKNLGFRNFFPCSDEKLEQTGHTLRRFMELVGIPHSLHSDNHNNLKMLSSRNFSRKLEFTRPS